MLHARWVRSRPLQVRGRWHFSQLFAHSSASTHAISASLARMLAHRFPSHTRDRQTEAREDVNHGPSMLPLFVIDFVLPGQVLRSSQVFRAPIHHAVEADYLCCRL
jgi:hypothetical protein